MLRTAASRPEGEGFLLVIPFEISVSRILINENERNRDFLKLPSLVEGFSFVIAFETNISRDFLRLPSLGEFSFVIAFETRR